LIHVLLTFPGRVREKTVSSRLALSIPVLALAGLGVAAYLAWIETAGVAAVCGPVGDCNTVQQSEYAHLLGIPMGVLGVVAYLGIFFLWLVAHRGPIRWHPLAQLLLFALTLGGILFSIYLTFLEPFVIGATCIWCLTSAIIMTSLLWLTRDTAATAWRTLAGQDEQSV
ncbi:MAG: vitamin K epoxide reductase family protein, partial [gamma proteobacterium symbiont of Bathyaustriella thionipta]|nr:vitamin K epoxide reductase family protein [gamma proteobacterium symbiont of Bathyaustriella thionipta]